MTISQETVIFTSSAVRTCESHCITCPLKFKPTWFLSTYLSIHIFSTWGTRTCKSLMIVCNGSFVFHELTHSDVGIHCPPAPNIPTGDPMPLPWARECASVSRILWRYGSNKGMECNAEQNRRMENSKENTICKRKIKINSKQKRLNERTVKKHKHSITRKYYLYHICSFQTLFVNLRKTKYVTD